MPTFDGGHCFLTALLPIKTSEVVDQSGLRSSPVHMVRDALAILPTAHQSPVTESLPVISPFVKSTKTHFARLAVIDDVIFNGRIATNAILDTSDRTIPQPVDQLFCPYLMVIIDFDAPRGTEAELRAYLRDIWTKMAVDLEPVFKHCFGYEQRAISADGFADYLIDCQIETTMPFNDYWPGAPPLTSLSIGMLAAWLLIPAGIVGAGLYTAMDALHLIAHNDSPWLYCAEIAAIVLLATVAGLYLVYRIVMARGAKAFPMAPNSDLPSVLKSLYLQRELIAFAIKNQGRATKDLFDDFGAFLNKIQLNNTNHPTQAPGVIEPSGIES